MSLVECWKVLCVCVTFKYEYYVYNLDYIKKKQWFDPTDGGVLKVEHQNYRTSKENKLKKCKVK